MNASAFLSDQVGECCWDLLQIFGLTLDIVIGGYGSAQIRDIDVVEVNGMLVEECSYLFRLFFSQLGQYSWLLSADGSFAVVLSFSVASEEQYHCGKVLLHSNNMTFC